MPQPGLSTRAGKVVKIRIPGPMESSGDLCTLVAVSIGTQVSGTRVGRNMSRRVARFIGSRVGVSACRRVVKSAYTRVHARGRAQWQSYPS